MKRDSMVFYRSWLDAINIMKKNSDKLRFLQAIVEYGLNGENIPTNNDAIDLFMINVRAQIDANNKNYENGKKGGAPVGNKNAKNNRKTTGKQPKNNRKTNNVNGNDNGNANANANVNSNNNTSSGRGSLEEPPPYEVYDEEGWEA